MKILVPLLLLSPLAHAVTLAHFDFEGATPYQDKANTAGVTVSAFNRGAAILMDNGITTSNTPPDGGAAAFFARGAALATGTDGSEAGFNAAKTNGSFVSFTVTADPGTTLNLTSLTLDLARWSGESNYLRILITADVTGDAYANRLTLSSNLSGIGGVLESNQNEIGGISGVNGSWGNSQDTSVDVSGAAFQGISSVTFNVYLYSLTQSGTGANTNNLYIDNIDLQGAIVPEPSAAVLSLAGLAALSRRRR